MTYHQTSGATRGGTRDRLASFVYKTVDCDPMMNPATMSLFFQLLAPARQVIPILSFPDARLDDTAAYQGYRTRFFRDAAGNTVQIYVDNRGGRIVHLLANAENESIGFTARGQDGRPVSVQWGREAAEVFGGGSSRSRTLVHELVAGAPQMSIGWFVLGSMRVERDFQYAQRHRTPFASPPFVLPEMDRLLGALGRLDAVTQKRHLSYLNATAVPVVRARLLPTIIAPAPSGGALWVVRVFQPSLDGRDTLALELRVDPARVTAVRAGDSISFTARSGNVIPFTVAISTTGKALTPLSRDEIFSPDFLRFLADAKADPSAARTRWLEREVRGVELLASREKLMAGLPAYATYFGRDMMVSALMMRPIWRADMSAFVIASVLRKLGPEGDVSHEEALGGQADREAADEYARLVDAQGAAGRSGDRRRADSLLARAEVVLREHARVRENYHMIDDEFQLPVLEASWLGDPAVSRERKRAFLLDASDGEARASRVLRELALVARLTAPYVTSPTAKNLVSFPQRDSTHWQSASWRDSNEGYAEGRFAMDVNAVWVPHALESMDVILRALRQCGISPDSILRSMPAGADRLAPLRIYARDSAALGHAVEVWRHAADHFVINLDAAQVRTRAAARIAAMPDSEQRYWAGVVSATKADQQPLAFLALSLDANGTPIGVANSDPATRLFLLGGASDARADVLRDVRLFVRPYPVGLLIDRVGPVVANDAYAPPSIWPAFERDRYHGPRAVWGREVNLFLLGVTNRLAVTRDSSEAAELRAALQRVLGVVEASGFHSELWSYEVRGGQVVPVRYGTGSDVQLWSTTDLAVQFALSRLRR